MKSPIEQYAEVEAMKSRYSIIDLAHSVIEWWNEHQYDVDSSFDGEYCEEYNRYDEEPEFVVIAKSILENCV